MASCTACSCTNAKEKPIMSLLYAAAGAVAVLGLMGPRAVVTKRVTQGQPYDVVLSASASFPNPMQDVDLTAVLSGPNGQELIVPGFWDGDRTFRIRVTLTAPGAWSYLTVSSDPSLDAQSGVIEAGPAVVPRTFAKAAAPAPRQLAACDQDCSALFDRKDGRPDLEKLRALDATIANAQREGWVVDVRLFVQNPRSDVLDPHAYGIVEYLVARYAAFPNVVWCAGSPSTPSGAGSRAAFRGLVRTLDPYFKVGDWQRPIYASCESMTMTRSVRQ
jgi:Domain of unknown function (DUF5060)